MTKFSSDWLLVEQGCFIPGAHTRRLLLSLVPSLFLSPAARRLDTSCWLEVCTVQRRKGIKKRVRTGQYIRVYIVSRQSLEDLCFAGVVLCTYTHVHTRKRDLCDSPNYKPRYGAVQSPPLGAPACRGSAAICSRDQSVRLFLFLSLISCHTAAAASKGDPIIFEECCCCCRWSDLFIFRPRGL